MSDKSIQVDSIKGGYIITDQLHEGEAFDRSVTSDPEVAVRRVAAFLGVQVFFEQPEQPSTETMVETSYPNVAGGTTTTKVCSDGTASIIATDASGGSIETVADASTSEHPITGNTVYGGVEIAEGKPEDSPEPIEPMTDLSGIDYSPAFEGYQPNGSLPETD